MLTHEQFTCIAQKYIDTVFRVSYGYLRSHSEAEDVVQNVFYKLLTADKDFESEEHIKHWLIRVAVNECKRAFMSPWRRTEPLESCGASSPSEHSELLDVLMALPTKYRVPLYLYYYEGYSVEECAVLLGRPVSTVKTQLRRGRELVKNSLREAEEI